MLRTILWFTGFFIYLLGSLFQALRLLLIKRKRDKQTVERHVNTVVKKWAKFVIRTIGAEVEVTGRENIPEGTYLLVGNHQGNLDIPLILSEFERTIGFVAKKELEHIPILSNWMREFHCVFMDRDNVREAVKSINEATEFLKQGYPMVIFPEGTRSRSCKLGEFKKGSLKLAAKADVPIIPITINGTYKAFEEKNRICSTKVKLIIDKPIYLSKLTREEQNNVTDIVRSIIDKNLSRVNDLEIPFEAALSDK